MSISELLDAISVFLGQRAGARDVVISISLLLGALGFGISLYAWKAARSDSASSGQIKKIKQKIEEFSVLIEDFRGRLNNSTTSLDKNSKLLEVKLDEIDNLQHQLHGLSESHSDLIEFDNQNPLENRLKKIEAAFEELASGKHVDFSAPDKEGGLTLENGSSSLALEFEKTENSKSSMLSKILGDCTSKFTEPFESLAEELDKLEKSKFLDELVKACQTSELNTKACDLIKENFSKIIEADSELPELDLVDHLEKSLSEILVNGRNSKIEAVKVEDMPKVVVLLGNSIETVSEAAKELAASFKKDGSKTLIASCSSSRESTAKSLSAWSSETGIEFLNEPAKVKPKAVAYKALHRAQDQKLDTVILTAVIKGKKKSSKAEVDEVIRMLEREQTGAPHETIVSLEAPLDKTSLEVFEKHGNEMDFSGIILLSAESLDSPGKLISLSANLNAPMRYLGFKDDAFNFRPFPEKEFIEALLLV